MSPSGVDDLQGVVIALAGFGCGLNKVLTLTHPRKTDSQICYCEIGQVQWYKWVK
jgi:hypothetical protein